MRARIRHHLPAFGSIGVRGAGVAAGFGITLLVGRMWGPEANGVYALVTQSALFLAVVSVGGVDLALLRFISAIDARGNRIGIANMTRILALTLALVLLVGSVVAFASLLHPEPLFGLDLPTAAIPMLLVIFVARALVRSLSAVLRAQRHYVFGQAIDSCIIPALVLVPLAAGLIPDVERLIVATAGAGLVSMAIGLARSLVTDGARPAGTVEPLPLRPLMIAAIPLWGAAIAQNLGDILGLTTVAAALGVHEAGLYRVATQFGAAFQIISVGLLSVYSAKIAAAHAGGDKREIARLSRSATRVSLALIIPPATIAFVFAPFILSLIGSEFVEAGAMLRVMIAGQVLFTALGPPGLVLALTGNERVTFWLTATSAVAMLIGVPIAAEVAGSLGVAACLAFVPVAQNAAAYVLLKRLTGIDGLRGSVRPVTPASRSV